MLMKVPRRRLAARMPPVKTKMIQQSVMPLAVVVEQIYCRDGAVTAVARSPALHSLNREHLYNPTDRMKSSSFIKKIMP